MKRILDVACGSRMFYFNKNNPDVLYGDIRNESFIMKNGRTLDIRPDYVGDFKHLKFDKMGKKLLSQERIEQSNYYSALVANGWRIWDYGTCICPEAPTGFTPEFADQIFLRDEP